MELAFIVLGEKQRLKGNQTLDVAHLRSDEALKWRCQVGNWQQESGVQEARLGIK